MTGNGRGDDGKFAMRTPSERRLSQRVFHFLIASTVLGTAMASAPRQIYAQQGEQAVTFNIPAQPLAAALSAFMRTSDWDVAFTSDSVAAKRSTAVVGRMSSEQALRTLLSGAGVSLRMAGAKSAALVVSAGANAGVGAEV